MSPRKKFQLNKPVRDLVLKDMQKRGQVVEYRILKGDELSQAPKNKILEEANEFHPDDKDPLIELGDILEAVEWAANELGGSFDKVRALQLAKRKVIGGFDKHIFVETVELRQGDKYLKYYESHPDRFPEIKQKDK